MDGFLVDIRHALRRLTHARSYAVVAIITLAFGTGANIAIYSILNALVWQTLPIESPGTLVGMTSRDAKGRERYVPFPAIHELEKHGPFQEVCGYNGGADLGLIVNGRPTQAMTAFVSGRCFDVFGVRPILGRSLTRDDAPLTVAGAHVVVISHVFWTKHFNGDPAAVGQSLHSDAIDATIVGVLPRGFGGMQIDSPIDVFAPPDTLVPARSDRRPVATQVLGRLRPGVTLAQAQAEMSAIWPEVLKASLGGSVAAQEGAGLWGSDVVLEPMGTGLSNYRGRYAPALKMTLGLTALLLAMACLNLVGLVLTQLASRNDEIALRRALGGSISRFSRQLVLEGVLIALPAAAIAMFFAYAVTTLMHSYLPINGSMTAISFAPTWQAFGISVAVALLASVAMTVVPGVIVAKSSLAAQRETKRTIVGASSKWSELLLVPQVALSIVLLVGALLLVRSLWELQHVDLGVQTARLFNVDLSPVPGAARTPEPPRYYRGLLEQVTAIPGVTSAAYSQIFPKMLLAPQTAVSLEGQPPADIRALSDTASPELFKTIGLPLLHGRVYTWGDAEGGRRVAVVSESLAKALAKTGGDIVDRKINFGTVVNRQGVVVVGVVGDASVGNPRLNKVPLVYFPPVAGGLSSPNLVITTERPDASLSSAVRGVLQTGGRHYQRDFASVDAIFARAPSSERMTATLAGVIAFLAATIALVGIHGTLAYNIIRRRRELGVRLALGAAPRTLAYQVQWHALRLSLCGAILAVPLSWAAVRLIESLVFGVSIHDVSVYVAAIVGMFLMAALGACVPALRASRVDPIVALRGSE